MVQFDQGDILLPGFQIRLKLGVLDSLDLSMSEIGTQGHPIESQTTGIQTTGTQTTSWPMMGATFFSGAHVDEHFLRIFFCQGESENAIGFIGSGDDMKRPFF